MCSLVIQKYIFLTFDGQPVASPVFSNSLVTMTERKRKRTPLRKIKMFFPAYAEGKTQIADARAEGFKVMDRIRIFYRAERHLFDWLAPLARPSIVAARVSLSRASRMKCVRNFGRKKGKRRVGRKEEGREGRSVGKK